MHYKLAVFGDSYADNKGPLGIDGNNTEGWEHYLCNAEGWHQGVDTFNAAEHGSNNWATYVYFEKFFEEHTADNVIVSFTTLGRLPMVHMKNYSYEYESYYNIHQPDAAKYLEILYGRSEDDKEKEFFQYMQLWNKFNSLSLFIDEETGVTKSALADLTKFINLQAWEKISQKCKQMNVNAVFLIPFAFEFPKYFSYYRGDDFPIIYGIDQVSAKETRRGEPGWAGVKWVVPNGSQSHEDNDARTNHLTMRNNMQLTNTIRQCLQGKAKIVDFENEPGLYLEDDCLTGYGEIQWDDSKLS